MLEKIINGTDDWIHDFFPRGCACWEDCTASFPADEYFAEWWTQN